MQTGVRTQTVLLLHIIIFQITSNALHNHPPAALNIDS